MIPCSSIGVVLDVSDEIADSILIFTPKMEADTYS
jgi:hypothetical protein